MRNVLGYCFIVALCVAYPFFASAQSSLSLSVSPTIYEMSANPGQVWSSSIKIINPNPYPLTVYTDTVNFEPNGETGQPRFLPILDASEASSTLAGWIQIGQEEITIAAEQSREIPFVISVPEMAPPGGHFAAVLVGTRPPEGKTGHSQLETSQVVTSLVFLRVSGEVKEDGSVRSFRTTERVLDRPEATFELRFENTGNVHLLPQGEIRILNMWGQERGIVPVNRTTLFGNVLPDSVRKFTFNWKGHWSVADIGRYTAVATLAYGEDGRQFTSADTAFWVIPWKPLSIVLSIIVAFIVLMTMIIKWYIRRVLSLAGVSGVPQHRVTLESVPTARSKVTAPLEVGMLDLRRQFKTNTSESGLLLGVWHTVRHNIRYVLYAAVLLCFAYLFYWFISSALHHSRSYEVEIVGDNDTVTVTSEDIEYEAAREAGVITPTETLPLATTTASATPAIQIMNRSGEAGLAAKLRLALEAQQIAIADIDTDVASSEHNTVIVYDPQYADYALEISKLINNALLSAYEPTTEDAYPIVIYVGSDYQDEVE